MPQRTRLRIAASLALAAVLTVTSPAFPREAPSEEANKKLVLDFYRALDEADAAGTTKTRIQAIAEAFLSPDYVQHAAAFAALPGPGSAREKLIRLFQTMPAMKLPPSRTLAMMAEGDLVMMLTVREMPDPVAGGMKQNYIFNMFRVKCGRLAEHWDLSPPPPDTGAPITPPAGGITPGRNSPDPAAPSRDPTVTCL